MKTLWLVSFLFGMAIFCAYSQDSIVVIPDTAFLFAIIDAGVDTNGDSLITFGETEDIHILDVSGDYYNKGEITDITGIEAFDSIEVFRCNFNEITSLDLSENAQLRWLHCSHNRLFSLDLSANQALERLTCSGNYLSELDVSSNTRLGYLNCSGNQITSLDFSIGLNHLDCGDNQLLSLNTQKIPNLEILRCGNNLISELDLSSQQQLRSLSCYQNRLWGALDLSNCNKLESLNCLSNNLSSIEWPQNSRIENVQIGENLFTEFRTSFLEALTTLRCSDNFISSLYLSENNSLEKLEINNNLLSSLVVNKELQILLCNKNHLTSLDLSDNSSLQQVDLRFMPTLENVCVWKLVLFPEAQGFDTTGSPNINFILDCNQATSLLEEDPGEFLLYPNPVHSILTIEDDAFDDVKLDLLTVDGQYLQSFKPKGPTIHLDLSPFKSGVYFITIRSRESVTTRKIIKL